LYDFYRTVIIKLYEGLKIPFLLSGDERVEDTPVHEALRESLINVLIHADYSGSCSILAIKQPDLFGFRNPGLLRVPRVEALRGGISDCRNRNIQKMFQMLGLSEQAGSGFPKIYKNWKGQHWKNPELEERFESNQTILTLRMSSLLPEEIVDLLRNALGKKFDTYNQIERIALVTAKAEGCVTHRRLTELTKEHPSELTKTLHGLVDKKVLMREGTSKGTFYYLKGEHPIQSDIVRWFRNAGKNSEPLATSSEPLATSSEPLDENSEGYKQLQQISQVVRDAKKSPSKLFVKKVIVELCSIKALSMIEIAELLGRSMDYIRNRYVNPMCDKEKTLRRKYPNIITHPGQRYYTAKKDAYERK